MSSLTVLTFSKVMDRHLLGAYELGYSGGIGLAKWGIKVRDGKVQKCEDTKSLKKVVFEKNSLYLFVQIESVRTILKNK